MDMNGYRTVDDYADYKGPHLSLLRKAQRLDAKINVLENQAYRPLYRNNPDIYMERMQNRMEDARDAFMEFLNAIGDSYCVPMSER